MEWSDLIDILTFTIPGVLVIVAVYIILKKIFENEHNKRVFEIRLQNTKVSLPIRLQAYERLTIFLERVTMNTLINRVKKPGMNAAEMHISMLADIRAEFEHNVSQQIYIQPETWNVIRNAKEEMIKIINLSYGSVGSEATATELSKTIFEILMKVELQPTQYALTVLKREVMDLF